MIVHESANTIDGRMDDFAEPSILDRSISLESVTWVTVGWVAVAFVGFMLRVMNFSAWPLSASEARVASNALAIVQGGSIPAAASTAPLPTSLTALALFLFGASDGIVRLVPLLAGLGTIALVAWLRPFASRGTALSAAFLVAISPTLVAASRHADSGGLLVFSSMLAFVGGLRWLRCRTSGYAVLFGIAAAMTVMSAPIGWIALPIVAIVTLLISDERNAPVRDLPLMLLGFAVTIIIVTTTIFIHPAGFSDFFRQSFRALWDQNLSTAGAESHLAVFQLVIDETLSVLLAIVAIVILARTRPRNQEWQVFAAGLTLWAALALFFASLLGGKDTTLFTLSALPLALLGGVGLDLLLTRVHWPDYVTPRGALFLVLIPITFFAGVSTYGLLASDVGSDAFAWLFTFILVAVIVFAPLLALTLWLRRSLLGWKAVLLLFVVVLLVAIGVRSSVLLGDTVNDRPGEPLTIGYSEPAVGTTVDQIRAVSRDMTTFEQDVRDPAGGHGLTIVIDSSIDEPFRWYFRDFPNVLIFDPNQQIPAAQEPQVLIARSDHASMLESTTNSLRRTLPLERTAPIALTHPSLSSLLRDALHPGRWQRLPEFLNDRQVLLPTDPTHFMVSFRQDVVKQMYGSTPPSSP
jgi:4-amino-4-deoxy-L-arabinose transferase-like glycosyltransferase